MNRTNDLLVYQLLALTIDCLFVYFLPCLSYAIGILVLINEIFSQHIYSCRSSAHEMEGMPLFLKNSKFHLCLKMANKTHQNSQFILEAIHFAKAFPFLGNSCGSNH